MNKILALNPFHGGSHRAFLNGWMKRSWHQFSVNTLSAHHWKWRMRHSAFHFADAFSDEFKTSDKALDYDVLFCTDMLNLAEFRGLAPPAIRNLPAILYFHENQLTYPVQEERERDLHFAYTNFVSAYSAESIWFNSEYHRDEFLTALEEWLPKMPDANSIKATVASLWEKSDVHHPGVDTPPSPPVSRSERNVPLQLLWVSRWEHDKGPEIFFESLRLLQQSGVPFRVSILGESYEQAPTVFEEAKRTFPNEILHWGYLENYAEYQKTLSEADVVLSTARHEFFGIAILEAVAAGCRPLVPRALAYPEVLPEEESFFHHNDPAKIAEFLGSYAANLNANRVRDDVMRERWYQLVSQYGWNQGVPRMDAAVDRVVSEWNQG
ncbi:GDP-mannose-dependent alpha-(1-6)-phosphatidylinositol dimannoside mannosyltransferase [Polystyrenella longa]|uniref:tRNA-queuosine alpha-mannosyltransferase n=1 Tax=Polystyrenella longa TaxID=2528007 RepID=A0A518CNS4_9PLAN|nr:DUF3524 domain-containing protein [Polystyrenella longa]QDU80880.1 GDP-mannose-dependent alpha-(1-6)-phosphatidylinositol dimannoside mannosyltransferase [Polystyrenella longa]